MAPDGFFPSICSGAMNNGDPKTDPVMVRDTSSMILAMPKSAIFTGAIASDQQVVGLDVAMDDSRLVRGAQTFGSLAGDRHSGEHIQPPPLGPEQFGQ
jgi:hypothetical protein